MYVKLVSKETAAFYTGISELLTHVLDSYGNQIELAALSNACGAYVRAVLTCNNFSDSFIVQLGADEVPKAKPSPEGLLQICKQVQIEPSECVYIGDSPSDGAAAKAAGMMSIGVLWGSHPESTVRPAFTETVSTIPELKVAIDKMMSDKLK